MKHALVIIIAALLFAGCKSKRQLTAESAVAVDSVALSERHRAMAVLSSAISTASLDFDTLEVSIEPQPAAMGDLPPRVRVRAVGGRLAATQSRSRDSIEAFNSLDTVAFRRSSAETRSEHSATTRLYNPPDGTVAVVVAILAAAFLLFLLLRKK